MSTNTSLKFKVYLIQIIDVFFYLQKRLVSVNHRFLSYTVYNRNINRYQNFKYQK